MPLKPENFPNLHPGNYRSDGPKDDDRYYNCIAWAAGFNNVIWDPMESADPEVNFYWPAQVPRDYAVASLIAAFESVGFTICSECPLEEGIEKIAIYADGPYYEHAARQLESGKWTSKIGRAERIEHDAPENLEGPAYGRVTTFMKRPRTAAS